MRGPRGARATRGLGVLASLAMVTGCGLQGDPSADAGGDVRMSQPAPELRGQALDGSSFDLSAHRGHPVVVDFWASWCGPCHKQQPELNRLYDELHPRGVIFIGVDMREDAASARAYIAELHVPYTSLEDDDGSVAGRFDIAAPPTTILVDSSGQMVYRRLGGVTARDFRPLIEGLLGGP